MEVLMDRRNKLIKEYNHDPYFLKEKFNDPAVCRHCGVVYRNGIFEWLKKAPEKAAKISCPACKRIEASYEGGVLHLEGEFLTKHKNEILSIIKKIENNERKSRPLERIINMVVKDSKIEITTTYEHMARRIGEAVHNACKGDMRIQYPEGEKYVRIFWSRND
jgi:predicted DNA-binding antitoxin AbrB/MazE fold protein